MKARGLRSPRPPITRIFVDRHLCDDPVSVEIAARTGVDLTPVSNAKAVYEWIAQGDDPIQRGKQTLYLTENRGTFVRECPGTRAYTCCGYMILHVGTYCAMDCAYCILQAYFHPPVLQLFINRERLEAELDQALASRRFRRIGTGEFTDSLIWEWWSELSAPLISRFARQSHACLELKTKTTAVSGFKDIPHNHKTIMAWSLNTEAVIHANERGTASLSARLAAARHCASWGYPLAFHFDPMMIYEGCAADYRDVVRRIFHHVPAGQVVWISMGSFRFMPDLKPLIQKRFPRSRIVYGEFIQGLDQKMRYFKPLRIRLYREVYLAIREFAPEVMVYLCMEDEEVWRKAFNCSPQELGGLSAMLDRSAIAHCRLKEDECR